MASKSPSSAEPFLSKGGKLGYEQVKTSEEEDANFFIPRDRPKSRVRTILTFILKVVVTALAVYGIVNLGFSASAVIRKASIRSCRCGSSIAEARAMGCKYDSLATSWLPKHCRDDEMTELFEKSGPGPNGEWDYYSSNKNDSKVYTPHEISLLADKPRSERTVWATIAWHDKHCFFTLLKQVRGKAKMQYTGFVTALKHAEHCAEGMAEGHPADMIDVSTSPGFGDPTDKELEVLMKMKTHGHQ